MQNRKPQAHCLYALGRVALVAATIAFAPLGMSAQTTRMLTACTPDAIHVCTELRLSSAPSFFEIALRTLGSAGQPFSPLAVYNLVLGTGAPTVASPFAISLPPVGIGGATVSDGSDWEIFDAGDAIFLSALSNRGIGGCVAGPDIGGFGQAATTCGAGQFASFRFMPTTQFDPNAFAILNLESVLLSEPLTAATCGSSSATCVITADTRVSLVPEPATVLFLGFGLTALAAVGRVVRREES